ncbi:MAG: prepilin-type N-terminal cleavage/methylation domain-containing protein [Verrucomicrobiota bacterium]
MSANHNDAAGFTLLELIVVVAALALILLCLMPALARTKPDTRAFQCLNNCRQLSRAWRMYADDNQEKFPAGYSGIGPAPFPIMPWIAGWLDWGTSLDNTNTAYLTDPKYSAMATYCGRDARPFKCPMDTFVSSPQRARGWRSRARSVSKNYGLGACYDFGGHFPLTGEYFAAKWTDLVKPKPSEVWMSVDENPDSINDGDLHSPLATQWQDYPANYHDGAAGVSFTDGHAVIHRWEASVLRFRINISVPTSIVVPVGDADMAWVRNHSPQQRP